MDISFTKEEMALHIFYVSGRSKKAFTPKKVQLLEDNSYVYAK